MNLLFVCSRNQWRSPTAEKMYKQKGYQTRSGGTSPRATHSISITDINWADIIFVMEKKHKNRLCAKFTRAINNKTIHILDIPDEYKYMDTDLITHLEDVLEPYLE